MPECPYCGRTYSDLTYLYRHAMTDHREAVLAHWIDEHDVQPPLSSQQQLSEVNYSALPQTGEVCSDAC